MTAEQFCLRWNNHQSTLVSVFDGLFESGTLVDCTLAADGQYLKAHKVVLSACSPYLEALLSQHYNQHPILILKDVKFEELKAMLEYMYRGEVNVTQEQLGRFLKAAETLQIRGLTNNEVGPGSVHSASGAAVAAAVAAVGGGPVAGPGGDARDVPPVRTRLEVRKQVVVPTPIVSRSQSPLLGNQTSLVDTLKLTPSKLVIDIPPISPVDSKEGSISPTFPRKRRKRNQSQNDDSGAVSDPVPKVNSETAAAAAAFKFSDKCVLDVDPKVCSVLDSSVVKSEVAQQQWEDVNSDYRDDDSEGELIMDEDYEANESKPGPSNGSSGTADGGAWHSIASDGENPESSKGDFKNSTPDRPGLPEHMLFPVMSMSSTPANQSSEKKYTCGNCGKSYMLASSLYTHEKYQCGKEPQFKCPYCPHKTKLKGNLKAHIGFKHADMPRPF